MSIKITEKELAEILTVHLEKEAAFGTPKQMPEARRELLIQLAVMGFEVDSSGI